MSKALLLILFFTAIVLSAVYFLNSDINPNVISYDHTIVNVIQDNGGIKGEFTAPNNYLGLLTLRFDNKDIIEKKSVFRIKEKQNVDWYHTSNIDTIQYNIKPLYTFGLPVIKDSKNKTYQFEVRILDYVPGDPTPELSKQMPIITSQYIFPWKVLFSDKDVLFDFLLQKISYQLQNAYSPWVILAYFLPLAVYLFYVSFFRKKYSFAIHIEPITLIALLGIVIDMFVLRNHYNVLALLLSTVWIGGIFFHKMKPQTSILLALLLLIWTPFFLVAHMEWVAEKVANWMFIFTSIGFLQYLFETFRMAPDRHPREDGDPV